MWKYWPFKLHVISHNNRVRAFQWPSAWICAQVVLGFWMLNILRHKRCPSAMHQRSVQLDTHTYDWFQIPKKWLWFRIPEHNQETVVIQNFRCPAPGRAALVHPFLRKHLPSLKTSAMVHMSFSPKQNTSESQLKTGRLLLQESWPKYAGSTKSKLDKKNQWHAFGSVTDQLE